MEDYFSFIFYGFLMLFGIIIVFLIIKDIVENIKEKLSKVIEISDDKTHKTCGMVGDILLYPEGAVRMIERFKKIKYQEAFVETCCGSDGCVSYNKWRNISIEEYKKKRKGRLEKNKKIVAYCKQCNAPLTKLDFKCNYCGKKLKLAKLKTEKY